MALLDELRGGLDRLGHAQARHDDGQAAAGKGADGDVVLHGGELGGGGEDAHVVELVEEQLFVLAAGGVFGGEEGEAVGELADGLLYVRGYVYSWASEDMETYAAEAVVLVVVFRVLDHVAPADELVAVVAVLLVCEEVCLAQELLLVMLELSHHFVGSLVVKRPLSQLTLFCRSVKLKGRRNLGERNWLVWIALIAASYRRQIWRRVSK